jgi:Flp pilus assembly CpaF family ATPase
MAAVIDTSFLRSTFLPIWELLEDESVNEIKVSPCGRNIGQIWAKRGGSWSECKNSAGYVITLDNGKINQMIEFVAGAEQKFAHEKENILEANVPILDYRFTGVKQPAAVDCAIFNIRKSSSKIFTFDDYVKFGTFPEEVADMLNSWIEHKGTTGNFDKLSIGIYGVTESGKTSFQNAYIDNKRKKYPTENWVILEDTRELNISAGNVSRTQCTEYHDMDKLLRTAKRQTPDNLVIGEVRGGEAALVVESSLIFNTIFGMHAKDFRSALNILERMILKNEFIDTVDKHDLCSINGWLGFQNVPTTREDEHGNIVRTYKKHMTEMVELRDYHKAKDEWQFTTLYSFGQNS